MRALYALIAEDDAEHERAVDFFAEGPRDGGFVTHNYAIVETTALLHRRFGGAPVRMLFDELLPVIDAHHVEEETHGAAVAVHLATLRRRPSLVDRVSFEVMRWLGIGKAFAFDPGFEREGFQTVP